MALGFTLNAGIVKQSVPGGVLRQGDSHASEILTVLSSLVFNHLAPITD